MSSLLAAFLNGVLLSAFLTGVVSVALKQIPRSALNASTRYLIWCVMLLFTVAAPLLYLASESGTRVQNASPDLPVIASDTALLRSNSVATVRIPPNAPDWLAMVWALLTVMLMAQLALSMVRLLRCKARAFDPPAPLANAASLWLEQCGSKRKHATLAFSNDLDIPTAVGFRRPMILFPAALAQELDDSQVEAIGLHEAAHLARYDDLAILPQKFLQSLFAWNPVVHFVSRCIDLEREIACDDLAVRATDHPVAYASCLARIAEWPASKLEPLAAGAIGRSELSQRVEWLLSHARPRKIRTSYRQVAGAVLAMSVLFLLAGQAPELLGFAAQQRLVRFPISVTDPMNRFVTGLEPEHFTLLENGMQREITQFLNTDVAISAVIAVNLRNSNYKARALEGANAIAGHLRSENGRATIIEGATGFAVPDLSGVDNSRKVLVLISDAAVLQAPEVDRDTEVFMLNARAAAFPELAAKVGVQLRNEYLVIYNSAVEEEGSRAIEIKIRTPAGLPELRVTTGRAARSL